MKAAYYYSCVVALAWSVLAVGGGAGAGDGEWEDGVSGDGRERGPERECGVAVSERGELRFGGGCNGRRALGQGYDGALPGFEREEGPGGLGRDDDVV